MIEETGTRRRRYWDLHDFGTGRGLEIGPLHAAMVRRDEADVRYLDVQDQQALREHYAGDPNVPGEDIPVVDYPLIGTDGKTRTLAEAAAPGAPFDWVVASHVIEHVPDVVTWLQHLGEVVADDGALVLAVPDRRYSFDVHRPPTTVGAMLQAHHARDTRPPARAVFDHFRSAVSADAAALWRGAIPTYAEIISGRAPAAYAVQQTLDGQYVDCHVWLFTPDSFVEQLHELRMLGASPWSVEVLVPTRPDESEFQVLLRRLPRGIPADSELASEVVPSRDRPDWLDDNVRGQQAEAMERRIERLERQLARTKSRAQNLRRTVRRQERQIARLEARPSGARAVARAKVAAVRGLGGRAVRTLRRD